MDGLLLEIRLSIGAIQAYVAAQEKKTVRIHRNKIEITDKDNVTRTCAFNSFTVQPNSCKGLQYVPNEGLHFRMTLGEDKLAKQYLMSDDVNLKLVNEHVSFYCATCGHCITKTVKFNRVLPLPSENWQEICSNIFCHGDSSLPAGDALSPRVDDCFTSDSDYMLHLSVLENESQHKSSQPPHICCTRCSTFLGSYKVQANSLKPSSVITLSRHSVSVKNSSGHIPAVILKLNDRRWIENWIACHLVKSSKDNFCHRFLIKDHDNLSKHYAGVWLLCPNTFILCNTYPKLSMANDMWHNFTGQVEDVTGKNIEMYQTVKVLYKCESGEDGKKLLDNWANDDKVQSLYLQQQLCLLLLLILMESNVSLPPSLQHSNGFKNGYLRHSKEYDA